MSLADLDNDGDLDALVVITGESTTSGVRVAQLRNDGSGPRPTSSTIFPNNSWAGVAAADVDSDNDTAPAMPPFRSPPTRC